MDINKKLDLTDYQTFVRNGFKAHTSMEMRLFDWTLGLSGEVGEVAELLKHTVFHQEALLDKMEIAKELADVIWYVTAIAETLDIPIEEALKLNMAKLEHRHGGNTFSESGSAKRHEKEEAFKDTIVYKELEKVITTPSYLRKSTKWEFGVPLNE